VATTQPTRTPLRRPCRLHTRPCAHARDHLAHLADQAELEDFGPLPASPAEQAGQRTGCLHGRRVAHVQAPGSMGARLVLERREQPQAQPLPPQLRRDEDRSQDRALRARMAKRESGGERAVPGADREPWLLQGFQHLAKARKG
jgi:hypothetical protein